MKPPAKNLFLRRLTAKSRNRFIIARLAVGSITRKHWRRFRNDWPLIAGHSVIVSQIVRQQVLPEFSGSRHLPPPAPVDFSLLKNRASLAKFFSESEA